MSNFIPGKIVKTFVSKKGKNVVLRYPKWDDLDAITVFANKMSQEDTFINMSGESFSKEEEAEFLKIFLINIEAGDKIYLCALVDNKFIGSCSIERDKKHRKRALHVGMFGIMLLKEFRGEGIGYEIAMTTINEAKNNLTGLKMITLTCFLCNTTAINLYHKLGFKKWGELPKGLLYKGDYLNEVTMYREL